MTTQKHAEKRLREAEERFRIAAETSNDLIYEWDLKKSVQWFGRIDKMLGYGPGEFPRTLDAWADSLHPEDRDRAMSAIQAHLEGRAPFDIEYRVRRKDGVYRWWTARGVAARGPDGKPLRWIGTITDITERKRIEAEREKLVKELQDALAHVKTLQGIIPICMYCKKIRDNKESWHRLEAYISDHTDALFSHGICPECAKEHGYDD